MCITYTQTELLRADNHFTPTSHFLRWGLIREGFVFCFYTSWSLHFPTPPLHCLTGRRGRNTTAYGTENSSDSKFLSRTGRKEWYLSRKTVSPRDFSFKCKTRSLYAPLIRPTLGPVISPTVSLYNHRTSAWYPASVPLVLYS